MPEYSARFIGPLAIALHERLVNVANDYVGECDATLDRFVEFEEPVVIAPRFPALFVALGESKIAQADDDSHVIGQHELIVEFVITGNNSFDLNRALPQYMLALDRAIRRMSQDDWGILGTTRGPVIWEVTDHNYQLRKNETSLRAEGQLMVVIQQLEL